MGTPGLGLVRTARALGPEGSPGLQLWAEQRGRVVTISRQNEEWQGLRVHPTTSWTVPGRPRNPDFRNHKTPLRKTDRDTGTSSALGRKTPVPMCTAQTNLCGGTGIRKGTDLLCTFLTLHSDVAGLQSHRERQSDKERHGGGGGGQWGRGREKERERD